MKKSLFTLFLIIAVFSISHSQTFYGREAQQLIPGSETVVKSSVSNVPAFIKFTDGSLILYNQLETWLTDHFKMNPALGLILLRTERDELGYTHYRYQQTYKGYPLFGNIYIVHAKDGFITCMNGRLYDKVEAKADNVFTEAAALDKAISYTHASLYKWQLPEEERELKYALNNEKATYYPRGELVMIPTDEQLRGTDLRLAYKFDIYAHQPMSRKWVFVDAATGKIIRTIDRIMTENNETQVNAAGTAVTKYSGTRAFTTDYTGTAYRLRETGRGLGIETYNMNLGTNYGAATDFTDADNTWNNVNPNHDEVAGDAHWGTERVWDYYSLVHGRNSVDNAGLKLLSYVHADLVGMGYGNNVNAFWDGTRMTYGDGDGTHTPLTTLDICGHEITHGVTENTANLTYSYESGALNEGYSDIFGTSVEFYAKPPLATGNWTIGEDMGAPFRDMSNPNAHGQPDTYQGTNWATGAGDNGGVHTNSGVVNYWYYLLCQGGTGTNDIGNAFNVTGITMAKAEKIAFRALTVYLTASSQYADARVASIQASSDLYGGLQETHSTTDAWYAVGVGAAYSATPTHADFYACPTTQCSNAPFTVQFTNSTSNGNTYIWYFGDGSTSTATNPSHTYTVNGAFNVKLVANGAGCGMDSITKTSYITVGPSYPCVASIPGTGTGTGSKTSCTGTLYDSGLCGDYVNNTDGNITISPSGALNVTLTFSAFGYELNYDYLYIYDGPTTASPQVPGSPFTGFTIPGPITSTGSSITIRQFSDQGVVASGFVLQWSCTTSTQPPVAAFIADHTTSCTGIINFTDQSTNSPTTWLWKFGDGQTSAQQNPVHTYTTNGTYTVIMKATNQYGTDSTVKTNYITINMPVAPTTTGASRCGTGTVTLSASGVGTLLWYDAPTGGNLVHTGPTFTTPSLSNTTNYYVVDSIPGAIHHCAKIDNTGGGGYTSTGVRYLKFTCFTPLTLVSVKIYGNPPAPGNRTVTLLDHTGNTLQSTTVNVLAGLNTYNLNFNLPVDTGLRLQCSDGTNLYRNNTGVAYPYTTAGYISVINSDAGLAYYYYYYDWIVQEPSCKSPRNIVTATINPIPVAPASVSAAPSSVCPGGSTILTATGGSGTTLKWMSGSCGGTTVGTGNNLSVSPAGNTTYYARWESVCGNSTCQNVPVTVTPLPVAPTSVSAAPSTICSGNPTILTATGGSGATLRWMTDSCGGTSVGTGNNLSVTPAGGTTYYARWENACGNSICKNIPVTVNPSPVAPTSVSATPGTICTGNSTILSATGGSGTTLRWMAGFCGGSTAGTGNNISISPFGTTTFYVRWENSCGNSTCQNVTVTVNQSPVAPTSVSANPLTICPGAPSILSASGGSGSILQWVTDSCNGASVGSGNNLSLTPITTTTYYAYWESAGCGKSVCQNVAVTVNPSAVAGTATPLISSMCSGNFTVINLTGQSGNIQWQTNASGTWQDIPGATGTSYTTPNLLITTSYHAVVSNGICPAVNSNIVTISIVPGTTAGTAVATEDTVCQGSSATINLSGNSGNAQWQTFTGGIWQDIPGGTGQTYHTPNLSAAASYRAIVTAGGCPSDSSNTVNISIMHVSVAGTATPQPAAICTGSSATINLMGYVGSMQWQTNASGTWQDIPGQTGTSYLTPNLTTTTSYRAVVTNGVCPPVISNIATVTVDVPSTNPVSISGDTSLCAGNSTTLAALGGILGGGAHYDWGTGSVCGNNIISGTHADTLNTGTISAPAVYWVRRSGGACNITTACSFIAVNVKTVPVANLTPQGPADVCAGEFVVLEATSDSSFQYSWSFNGTVIPGANQPIYSAFQSGSYTVEITNDCGTATSAPQIVSIGNPPTALVTLVNDTLFSSATSGNQWYLDGNPIAGATGTYYVPPAIGNYSVIVTDNNGCVSDPSNTYHYDPTGIIENNDMGIRLWPNPAHGIINIELYGTVSTKFTLTLTDVLGRPLLEKRLSDFSGSVHQVLDISAYASGCYFVVIEKEGLTIQKKIIFN